MNEETQLAQFVAQGKVFFASSGDAGQIPGYGPSYPAMSAWFTSVGGTTIHAVSANGGSLADPAWIFSGGGPSPWEQMPTWQSAFIGAPQSTANMGERAVPDVVAASRGWGRPTLQAWFWRFDRQLLIRGVGGKPEHARRRGL